MACPVLNRGQAKNRLRGRHCFSEDDEDDDQKREKSTIEAKAEAAAVTRMSSVVAASHSLPFHSTLSPGKMTSVAEEEPLLLRLLLLSTS